jgi:hypothetical protein
MKDGGYIIPLDQKAVVPGGVAITDEAIKKIAALYGRQESSLKL